MTFKRYKHLNVPDSWERYFTKYPQGMTILESLFEWVSQVDSMVDTQNKLSANVEQFRNEIDAFVERFDDRLQTEVIQTLSDWQNSGFIDVVISEAIQWQLDDYIATNEQDKLSLTEQLQQRATITELDKVRNSMNEIYVNVKDFGAVGDWNGDSGTDNLPAYNAALDFLQSRGGGTIYTPDGDYWISDRIHVQFSNVHFITAKGATIRATDFLTAGDAVITFRGGVPGGQVPNTLIENCSVTGGTYISMTGNTNSIAFVRCDGCYVYDVTVASGNKGVSTQEYNHNVHFEKIHVLFAPHGAITIETHTNNAIVKDVVIEECGRAIHLTGDVNDVIMENIICHKSTSDGISISTSNNVQLKNVILKNVTGRAIHSDNATNVQIDNCQLEDVFSYGLYFHTMFGSLKVNNVTMKNIARNGTHHGIYLNNVKIPFAITNSALKGTTHAIAVSVSASTGQRGQFRGNDFDKGVSDGNSYHAYDLDKPLVIDDIFGGVLHRFPT